MFPDRVSTARGSEMRVATWGNLRFAVGLIRDVRETAKNKFIFAVSNINIAF